MLGVGYSHTYWLWPSRVVGRCLSPSSGFSQFQVVELKQIVWFCTIKDSATGHGTFSHRIVEKQWMKLETQSFVSSSIVFQWKWLVDAPVVAAWSWCLLATVCDMTNRYIYKSVPSCVINVLPFGIIYKPFWTCMENWFFWIAFPHCGRWWPLEAIRRWGSRRRVTTNPANCWFRQKSGEKVYPHYRLLTGAWTRCCR